jgi:hypothetical protein
MISLSRCEVVQLSFTLHSKEGRAVSPGRIRKPSPALRGRLSRQCENEIMVAFDEKRRFFLDFSVHLAGVCIFLCSRISLRAC